MQSLREAASNLINKRKTLAPSRVSHVQAILDSVQVIQKSQNANLRFQLVTYPDIYSFLMLALFDLAAKGSNH